MPCTVAEWINYHDKYHENLNKQVLDYVIRHVLTWVGVDINSKE